MTRRLLSALAACWLGCIGCAGEQGQELPSTAARLGSPVQFSFGTVDGTELSSDTTRGRTTALLFVTTYDLPSQAEAELLRDLVARHKPVANAAIVMLEPPRAAPLAQVWREQLKLQMPVAMASPLLTSGESELGRISGVPTLIVLDRRGRIVVRREGALSAAELESCLKEGDGF